MTKISDLPTNVVEDNILSRVLFTCLKPVRSTCKNWYNSSKTQIFGKKNAARKQFLGFVKIESMVFSMVFDLQGIRNNDYLVDPSPSVNRLSKFKMSHVFHCDGLLLWVTKDKKKRLLVWNPYLGQTKLIQARKNSTKYEVYTLGYDTNNHNHKIFRLGSNKGGNEIYDFNSNSWKVLDLTIDCDICYHENEAVSLKENTYFFADVNTIEVFLMCFDYRAERFGPRLPLPFQYYYDDFDTMGLSCVRDEQLAVLYQHYSSSMVEIWITTKIELNDLSWSKFLKVDMTPRPLDETFPNKFGKAGNFFIDKEKKVVVIFDGYGKRATEIAYIFGEDGYFKSMTVEETPNVREPRVPREYAYEDRDFMLSSYFPSLLQLQTKQPSKRKQRDF